VSIISDSTYRPDGFSGQPREIPAGQDRLGKAAAGARSKKEENHIPGSDTKHRDSLEISAAAIELSKQTDTGSKIEKSSDPSRTDDDRRSGSQDLEHSAGKSGNEVEKNSIGSGTSELTEEEKEQLRELQKADREVRAHEQAHRSTAGNLAVGATTYRYETGPDGKRYAVAGEVKIRIPEGSTPEETIRIARQARRAALAPARPSAQDLAVASEASRKVMYAQAEIISEQTQESSSDQSDRFGKMFLDSEKKDDQFRSIGKPGETSDDAVEEPTRLGDLSAVNARAIDAYRENSVPATPPILNFMYA
jgi:hypothetical protein